MAIFGLLKAASSPSSSGKSNVRSCSIASDDSPSLEFRRNGRSDESPALQILSAKSASDSPHSEWLKTTARTLVRWFVPVISHLPSRGTCVRLRRSQCWPPFALPGQATYPRPGARLKEVGCGPLAINGVFRDAARAIDCTRRGAATLWTASSGTLTLASLASCAIVRRAGAPSPLVARLLDVATAQEGVRGTPGEPNVGRQVDNYVPSVGLGPASSYSWGQAFVNSCCAQTAAALDTANLCVRTADTLGQWDRVCAQASRRVPAATAGGDITCLFPDAVPVINHGFGFRHAGLAAYVAGNAIGTIECDANKAGSRKADYVNEKTRPLGSKKVGFTNYGLGDGGG